MTRQLFPSMQFRDTDRAAEFLRAVGFREAATYRDDDVRRIHDAALKAGATSVREPAAPEYGGLECAVRDAEGNQWSFGTYPGAVPQP